MTDIKLGKLKEVDIRKVWPHEQYDFSTWLAKENNIMELGKALNLSLTEVETEKFVGAYRCDILCKDEITSKTVLIENQLEPSNHDHLGKIITYASGLDAAVVVWIVEEARDEHASAVEWLNKHTDDEVAFFLVEVHAFTIGNSEPAPMFKVIEQPNDFAKIAKELSLKDNLKPIHAKRLEFWNLFREAVIARGRPFNAHKPSTNHWTHVAVGASGVRISVELLSREHKIKVCFQIKDDKDFYDKLYEHKDEIEKRIGTKLEWNRLDDKKASIISVSFGGLDFDKQDNYPELMEKCIDNVLLLKEAFKPYL